MLFDEALLQLFEADNLSYQRVCQAVQLDSAPEDIRASVEFYVLERFDNFASVLLSRVTELDDIEPYLTFLRSWLNNDLPELEPLSGKEKTNPFSRAVSVFSARWTVTLSVWLTRQSSRNALRSGGVRRSAKQDACRPVY